MANGAALHIETRQKILNAALLVAAKEGFERATTEQISRKAGVSEGIIYHYFRSKRDLCVNMVRENAEGFRRQLTDEIGPIRHPKEKLERLIDFHFTFFMGEGSIFRVIFGRGGDTPSMMEEILRLAILPYSKIIEEIIKEGIKEKEFRAVDAAISALNLLGMMQLPVIKLHLEPKGFSAQEAKDNVKKVFFGGMLK